MLKLASNYGISLLISVLVILLAVVICYLLIKHVPALVLLAGKWVDGSLDTQCRVATAVESLSETLGTATEKVSDIHRDTQAILMAGDQALGAIADAKAVAKAKHDIPSDVFDKFEKSREILRQRGFQT